jgi:hypothetical protein
MLAIVSIPARGYVSNPKRRYRLGLAIADMELRWRRAQGRPDQDLGELID